MLHGVGVFAIVLAPRKTMNGRRFGRQPLDLVNGVHQNILTVRQKHFLWFVTNGQINLQLFTMSAKQSQHM